MYYFKNILFLFFLIVAFDVSGQSIKEDSMLIKNIKTVQIYSSKTGSLSTGAKIIPLDTLFQNLYSGGSITDLLRINAVSMKTNGAGGLASIALRGSGANHTAVLWNGLNLQSSMNGQFDFSLLPIMVSDKISIQNGGAGALWGNGMIGGAVILENSAIYNSGLSSSLSLNYGSYGKLQQTISVDFGNKTFTSRTRAYYSTAENNFPFINNAKQEKPKEYLSNASVMAYGLIQDNTLLLKNGHQFGIHAWVQWTERQLPPNMLQQNVNTQQNDHSLRFSADWQKSVKRALIFARLGYVNDYIHYIDSISRVNAISFANTINAELESKICLGKHHLLHLGINDKYLSATVDDYSESPKQNLLAVFVAYKLSVFSDKLQSYISIREELNGTTFLNPVPSAGISIFPLKFLEVKALVSKNYRLPDFNELYWNPGGNKNLKPESGWSEEIGLKLTLNKNIFSFSTEITAFNRNTNDWIMWQPQGSYWTPRNLLSVKSYGIESLIKTSVQLNNFRISLSGTWNYTSSTNQDSKLANDQSLGKQLIYVPRHTAGGSLSFSYKKIGIVYSHNYNGIRYITSDNSDYLPTYHYASLNLYSGVFYKTLGIDFLFGVENLYNTSYNVLPWQPMPPRNYRFGIKINYKTNKSLSK